MCYFVVISNTEHFYCCYCLCWCSRQVCDAFLKKKLKLKKKNRLHNIKKKQWHIVKNKAVRIWFFFSFSSLATNISYYIRRLLLSHRRSVCMRSNCFVFAFFVNFIACCLCWCCLSFAADGIDAVCVFFSVELILLYLIWFLNGKKIIPSVNSNEVK